MTILQPITTKFPANKQTLEESGLPCGFAITPFAHRRSLSIGDDDEFNQTARNNQSASRSYKHLSRQSAFPTKASLIAKCLHCGSPMNPTCRFLQKWSVLCSLCGNVYDVHYDSQSQARIDHDQNHENRYRSSESDTDSDSDFDGETFMTEEEAEYNDRYEHTRQYALEECINPVIEYSLPLLSAPSLSTGRFSRSLRRRETMYALPAGACPPLLAVFIDGTSDDMGYYARISDYLKRLIHGSDLDSGKKNDYKGTRVGIFIMTKNGSLSIFDLTNPGGHLKHVWVESCPLQRNPNYESGITKLERELEVKSKKGTRIDEDEYAVAPLADLMTPEQIFCPLDDNGIACIDNALRELADSRIAIQQACQREYQSTNDKYNSGNNSEDTDSGGAYLGRTIQYFMEFMEDVGYHPGDTIRAATGNDQTEVSDKFLFAGGKIMCFLSRAPDEIGDITLSDRNGRVGNGGFGGSCAEVGKRFKRMDSNSSVADDIDVEDPDDIESGDTEKLIDVKESSHKGSKHASKEESTYDLPQIKYLGLEEYYHELGMACAINAFGVEVFALVSEDFDDDSKPGESFLGMPYLRVLSDRSGGCGPLISKLPADSHLNDISDEVFLSEILARSPWQRTTAFGTMLKIRLPPSLRIDTSPDHTQNMKSSKRSTHELYKYTNNNGMLGSVTASGIDDELYLVGSCDNSHTFSFDVDICSRSGDVDTYVSIDGVTDFRLKACVQTSFAYTSVVKSRGEWITVRRLRVTTNELELTDNVETLTSSLDSEVLAVNWFHKLHANSLLNGLRSTEDNAMNWLLSTLLYCYESAINTQKKIEKYGLNISETFFPGDRLLDYRGSQKSRKEILLARGHDEIQHLPLLTFALIQCDALRPNSGDYNPSIDARAAAAANMGNMTPDVLARRLAPRIEFWISGKNSTEPLIENVKMSLDEVRYTIANEIDSYDGKREEFIGPLPILFLDTPCSILIYDCQDMCKVRTIAEDDLPPSLMESRDCALKSYRVQPPFFSTTGNSSIPSIDAFNLLSDCMVEDSLTSSSKHESYEKWCTVIAEILFSEITDDE